MTSPQSESPWLAPETVEVLRVSGSDAKRFLNDLISQEIDDMARGTSRRSFLLGPQGKLDFMFWVGCEGDRFDLVIEGGRGDELSAALSRYLIRVDVVIDHEPADTWLVIGQWDGLDVSWGDVERRVVTGAKPDLPTGSLEDYERLRISAGEPRWGVDVDGSTIPHESGLVPVAVNFDKGCFLGQELVARIDRRGANVPRHLRVLEFEGQPSGVGSSLSSGDREVGIVTSAVDGVGLAMVRREVEIGATVTAGTTTAIVKDLPPKSPR